MRATLPAAEGEGIMLSTVCLLIFFGGIGALISVAFHDALNSGRGEVDRR